MTKVGILSMQRIANYGSFLQAYGLKCILEEIGCEVQFVDYHPGNVLVQPEETGLARKIRKVTEIIKIKAPLSERIRFINFKKNYAKNYYSYLGIDKEMNYSPAVDVLIIGSDEVFNCIQSNSNVGFSLELFGAENNAKKVLSYAASFGNTTLELLREHMVDEKIAVLLKQMEAISVRDDNSGRIIKNIVGIEPEYHLDPVLVYDFVGKREGVSINSFKKDYMIVYGYSGRFSKAECREIRKYAKNKKLQIICIGGIQEACDKFIDCNPFEVIEYFRQAECVITDTFHGTILSIITHRRFVTIVRKAGYGNAEKVLDLLDRLDLRSRVLNNLDNLCEKLNESIVYEGVDNKIDIERKKSYEYLKKYCEI